MNRNKTPLVALAFAGASIWIVVAARAQDSQAPKDKPTTPPAIGERLSDLVAEIRAEKKLVGLGAMIMIDGKVVAAAADGERKKGSGVALEVGDRWHLGSITKSMTATMIARLVEKQEFQWTTTVGECLGESIEMHADWRGVTLEQLLTHTSGAPPNFPIATQFQRPPEGEERMQARRAAVAAILEKEPRSQPGKSYRYMHLRERTPRG